jgi:hypothetical protein
LPCNSVKKIGQTEIHEQNNYLLRVFIHSLTKEVVRMINYFAAEYENTSDGETNICSVKTELLEDGANSSLAVARADKQDSGNYTCSISPTEFATVAIHVLNGKINFIRTHNTLRNAFISTNHQHNEALFVIAA